MTFEAKDLADLAEFFEHRAAAELEGSHSLYHRRTRASVWREAASIIRKTALEKEHDFIPDRSQGPR